MLLVAAYWTALAVVIFAALVVALHPAIPGGFVRTFWCGGVVMFGLAGFAHTPPTWLCGFMACLAGACVWGASRWWHCRAPYADHRRMQAALRRRA